MMKFMQMNPDNLKVIYPIDKESLLHSTRAEVPSKLIEGPTKAVVSFLC